jgi:hypothetical protein
MSRRRASLIAIVVLAVLAALAFLPALPPVRGFIVERVVQALERSGTHVTYTGTEGNAWRGVALRGATIAGPGVGVTVDRLRVGYFLPSLIGGELPLDIEVSGARGRVDLSRFLSGTAAAPGAPAGPLTLQLRRLALDDVSVDVEELPFTLPDATLSDVQVAQSGTALDLTGTVTTADGSAYVAGRFETLTGSFDARVERADATLARNWWQGVTAGEVTGELHVRGSQIAGSFDVTGGAVDDLGIAATGVAGHVVLDYPVITADLTGNALGGPVAATGVVNVDARRWEAQATGSPGLAEAAGWLLRGSYPDGPPVALVGTASVELSLSGWDHVVLDGSATAAGTVEGLPLDHLSTAFRLPPDGRIRAQGLAVLGGGDVRFELGPGQEGDDLVVTADGVGLSTLGEGLGAVDARLRLALGGREDGELALSWAGEVAGRQAEARLDARLDPDGWQGFVTGSDSAGARLEGAVVLADGTLEGGLTLSSLGLDPLPAGASVALGVSGPASLDGARVTVALTGDDPVTVPGLPDGPDLRGSASGVYDPARSRVTGLVGRFGPVIVSGALDLDPVALVADVIVEPTRLALEGGVAAASLTVPSSSLVFGTDGLSWHGRVEYADASAGPAATADGALQADASLDAATGAWRVTAASAAGDLRLEAGPGGASAVLDGLPVTVADGDGPPALALALSGRASAPSGAGPVSVDVTVDDAGGGRVALPAGVSLAGDADVGAARLHLAGAVGDLPVTLGAAWDGPLRATAELGPSGSERVVAAYDAATGQVTAAGEVDLARYWRLVTRQEPPLEGTLALDLSGRLGAGVLDGVAGTATVAVTSPVAATAVVTGRGDSLAVTLEAEAAGLPVRGAGEVRLADLGPDTPLLTVDAGPLEDLVLTVNGLEGSGTIPGVAAGPAAVPDVPWSLRADWSGAPTALVRLADSELTLTLEGGAVVTSGPVTLPATYAGEALALTLDLPERRVDLADPTAAQVRASVSRPGEDPLLEASGTPGNLAITGAIPAGLLAAPLPEPARPAGELAVSGSADLLAGEAAVSVGEDVAATFRDGTLELTARGADLTTHVPAAAPAGLRAQLDGTLRHEPERGWLGELVAGLSLPGTEPTDATVTLTGAGPELALAVAATGPLETTLLAHGTVSPELRLEGDARALGGAVTAAIAATPEDGLRVALSSAALAGEPYFTMPPLAASLTVPAAGGGPLLTGDWVDARVAEGGTIEGRVELPFTLLGAPATLTAELGGTLDDPTATATLTGAGVTATAEGSLRAASAEATLTEPAIAAALPAGARAAAGMVASPVLVRAAWTPADGWDLDAAARAELPAAGQVDLALALSGDGAVYAGELAASLPAAPGAAPVAVASLAGEGADLTAELDMAAVDFARIGAAYGVDVDVLASGRAFLGTDPATAELTLDVSGTVEGAAVSLAGSAPDDLRFTLRAPQLDVAGRLAWHERRRVVVSGQAAGQPIDAWLEVDDAFENGRLHVDVPGASLEAVLAATEPGVRTAAFEGGLAGGPLGLHGELSGEVVARGAEVSLADLTAELSGLPAPLAGERLAVAGSGTLAPRLDVGGALTATEGPLAEAAGEGAWRVAGDPLEASVTWLGLEAAYGLGSGEARLRPVGDVAPAVAVLLPELAGADLRLEGPGLAWSREAGFGGALTATASGGPVPAEAAPVTVALRGASGGDLAVAATAGEDSAGAPLVALNAVVPAHAPLTGALTADVAIAGAVEAAGRLTAGAGGLTLDVAGEGLSLQASVGADGWSVSGALDGMPVADVLPLREDPRVSLSLTGGSATGGLAVEDLVVASGASRLEGSASFDGRLRMALRAQVDLADVDAGDTRLTGLLRGPIVLVAPQLEDLGQVTVTAQLDAAGVGVAGVPVLVDGGLQVGGTAADPVVFAALYGRGDLRGALRLEAAPRRGRLDVRSTLAYRDLTSDVQVAVSGEEVVASGSLRAGDAVLLVSDLGGAATLTGAGRLDGWQGTVSPGLAGFVVEGPLAALSPTLRGSARLALGEPAGEGAWLRGEFADLAVAGQEVGDLAITSATAGAPIAIDGDGVSGVFDPADQSWILELEGLTLPGSLTLALAAAGRGPEGRATGRLAGGAELGVDVGFAAEVGAGGASFSASGTALGGELSVSGRRPAGRGWTGEVALQGAELPATDGEPAAVLSATGVLQGSGPVPQVILATAAYAQGAGVAAAGRASIGPGGVTLDQTVALPRATAPLRVEGRLAPGLDVRLSAAGAAPGQPSGEVRLLERQDGLAAMGALQVPLGPVTVRLGSVGSSQSPQLTVTPTSLPDARLSADLAADGLLELVSRVASEGLVVTGGGAASGSARLDVAAGSLELRQLGLAVSGFRATLSGRLAPASADLEGWLELPLDTPDPASRRLPVAVSAAGGQWRLSSSSPLGEVAASYDASSGAALLDVALELRSDGSGGSLLPGVSAGAVSAHLAYEPGAPPSGTLSVDGVRLTPPGWGEVTVNADAALANGRLEGAATVATAAGSLSVSGDAPVPRLLTALGVEPEVAAAAAGGSDQPGATEVELRLRTIELGAVPLIASSAPHLSGALSGVVRLQGDFVFGQLVAPDLAVGENSLPVTVQVSGPTSRVDADVMLGRSLLALTLSDLTLSGSARLERLPLDLLAEAVVGPTDVTALLTGVARVDLPLTDPGAGYAAVASEELTLQRAGVLTRGEVTLVYDRGSLSVERATFSGRGDWHAAGVLAPDRLDFELVADEADFGPLLGLVPGLALLGVGAEGSFAFAASGTLAEPLVTFQTDALDFSVAGTTYRLADTDVSLEGAALSAEATLSALSPVRGDLRLAGDATLVLEPFSLRAADLRFEGALVVPGVGRIEDVSGSVTQDPLFRPFLALTGRLGAPLAVQGTLVPLDLRAGGTGLHVAYPGLLIADSTLAADLRLVGGERGVALSGAIEADEVVIDPSAAAPAEADEAPAGAGAEAAGAEEARAGAGGDAAPAAEGAAEAAEAAGAEDAEVSAGDQAAEDPRASTVDPAGMAPSPVAPTAAEPAPAGGLASLRFDDLRITAPQRVVMTTSFASLEASLDLTLSGTGAEPRLSGEARALRGNLRFSGRDFTVDQAVATFSPNRGVLPDLDVSAHTEFEKARVLAGSTDVEFVAPEGRTFRVDLAFSGPVELDEDGGVRFDVRPTLTSEALIEVGPGDADPAAAAGNGVRPLTQAELLTLVTLGRLELGSDLIGAGGLGGAVAQGALDTAVDVLLLGELQNALREALGLDVLEIRTSSITQLIDGDQPFGVSVRLGGYLNPELFASYRIGTADPDDPGFAVTNEVALQYALGPLDLEVSGRIDFPTTGVLASPRSALGLGLSYDVSRWLGLDLSTSLSTERSLISFGVTLRW